MERNQKSRLTFLDTHIAIWLCAEKRRSFPAKARQAIEGGWLSISPMVLLELNFLHEIGRLKVGSEGVLNALSRLPVHIDQTPFQRVTEVASAQIWTRDPFDRLIVGQAIATGGWLVTADEKIREHFPSAIWD